MSTERGEETAALTAVDEPIFLGGGERAQVAMGTGHRVSLFRVPSNTWLGTRVKTHPGTDFQLGTQVAWVPDTKNNKKGEEREGRGKGRKKRKG